MKKVKFWALIASITVLTGCATIISGSRQSVSFSSTPSAAFIYDNGMPIGQTPFSAKLKINENHSISIRLEGYQPYEVILQREFNGWYLGNILCGGIFGLILDPITGAIYKLTPDQVFAVLGKQAALLKQSNDDIYISVSLTPDPDWEYIGSLSPL